MFLETLWGGLLGSRRVGGVAPDDRRGDVVELARSLSPPSGRADKRPVRPDYHDVIGLAVEDVQVGMCVCREQLVLGIVGSSSIMDLQHRSGPNQGKSHVIA